LANFRMNMGQANTTLEKLNRCCRSAIGLTTHPLPNFVFVRLQEEIVLVTRGLPPTTDGWILGMDGCAARIVCSPHARPARRYSSCILLPWMMACPCKAKHSWHAARGRNPRMIPPTRPQATGRLQHNLKREPMLSK
jgi:hypothetical protein